MTAGKMNVKEKIKDIHFYRAVSDISRPIADSTHTISQIGFYIVELMTAEGVRGQGYIISHIIAFTVLNICPALKYSIF